MPSLFMSAALVASAALSMALPADKTSRTVHTPHSVVQVPGPRLPPGPIAMMNTYKKFQKLSKNNVVVPHSVSSAAASVASVAAAAATGEVQAVPEAYDQSYLCPVSVGGQTLTLDFDTGSADLWVFSSLTPSSESSGHATYNPSNSGKLKSGYTWNIGYGDGSGASGVVYADKVVVGGVTATSQAVEAATSVSSEFTSDTQNDGLLGLAFSSINTVSPTQQTTFFDTVLSKLALKVFTADLKKGQPGTYDFGFIDPAKYIGSITYVPVDSSQGFWGFTAGGYSVGSSSSTSGSIGASIADTGTTLLYLPDAVVSAYYAKVSGSSNNAAQGGYIFPCKNTLPNFNVNIGGTVFTVPGSYINYAPIDSAGRQCFGGIQSNDGIGFNIFGDIFLKSVFAVFDKSQSSPRLGFAVQ